MAVVADGGGAGAGTNKVFVNLSYLDGVIKLLTKMQTKIDNFDKTITRFKGDFEQNSRFYEGRFCRNHMAYTKRGEGESLVDYNKRKEKQANEAKAWIRSQKSSIVSDLTTLSGSANLSALKKSVTSALTGFTNIKALIDEFDNQGVNVDYENFFKSAVADAAEKGILLKSYDGSENSGGTSDNGEIQYEGENGRKYTGKQGRRAAATQGMQGSNTATAAAALGVAQGWTPEDIAAVQDAGWEQTQQVVRSAFETGSFEYGNDRDSALAFYKRVTGEDYDPDRINEQTLRELEEAGVDPDVISFLLSGKTGGMFGTAAASVMPVVVASLPSVIQGAKVAMSPDQLADFSQKLAISPVTGEANEDILQRLGVLPGSTSKEPIGYNRTSLDPAADAINEALTYPASTVYTDTRLSQQIADSISGFLPGGNNIGNYSSTDQARLIEQQAMDQYFSRSSADVEAERARLLSQTEDAYNGIGVDEFKDQLRKGGYSETDINYIMEHKEVGFTALVTATQASSIADLSNNLASQNGLSGLDFGKNLDSMSLYNGQAQASLGAEQDPDVTKARTAVTRARANYQQKVDNANNLINKANEAKDELTVTKDRIIKRSGEDTSKWTEEDIKEYNDAVEKYNKANKAANEAVQEADGAKDEYNQSEADYKEIYDAKYEEYLKEAQEGIKAAQEAQQQEGAEVPQEVGEQGAEIPGEGYDGGDQSILSTLSSGEEGLNLGDGEQALGATVTTPQSEVASSSDDQAILSGLNLGGDGMSIGTPDMGATVSVEPPVNPQVQVAPQQSQSTHNVDIPGVNNVQVNETAFTDERVLPDLGLSIDMNTITGGSRNVDIPIGGAVDGVTAFSAPTESDAAILNGLNITEGGISNAGGSGAPVPQIETPTINTMVSPELSKEIDKELTSDFVDTAVRESSNSPKIDTSKFVEPPSSTEEVQSTVNQTSTKVENGIVIEIGKDGSLRL